MVTSRSSAAVPERSGRRQPLSGQDGQGTRFPDVTLPLRFLLAGVVALGAGIGTLIGRPELLTTYHYHPHTIAITHLFLLGFLLSVVFGATYQLVPVALETTLASERLARWHFPIHILSVAGMVWMFWIWNMKDLGHFGCGLALGVGFFLWNLGRTLLRVRRWTVISFGIASALFWLAAVVTAGLAVAAAKCSYELVDRADIPRLLRLPLEGLKATADVVLKFEPLGVMHAHAHLGVVGVFVLLTVAVAYKLVPMFLLSEVQRPWRAWTSMVLLNAGLLALVPAIALQAWWKPIASGIVIMGLLMYGFEIAAIVRARRRHTLDWGIRAFLAAQACLVPVAGLGLFLSWPTMVLTEMTGRLENAYGFLAILGVLGLGILGMLHKILPFLVWFAAYGREIGRARTPSLQEMQCASLQAGTFLSWLTGLAICLAGILLGSDGLARMGLILLALALGLFATNALRILGHLVRPKLAPMSPPPHSNPLCAQP